MKKAFTLAEVLVSLTVIGVIAAITIPSMTTNTRNIANAEGCKKAYIVLSEAMEIAKLNEDYDKWTYTDANTEAIYKKIKPFIPIRKECINSAGCWASTTKKPNNVASTDFSEKGYGSSPIGFKTNDGMNITMGIGAPPNNIGVTTTRAKTVIFVADVNGDKGPNKLGQDIFFYILGDKDLVPGGNDNTSSCATSGLSCAAKVITEKKINY